MNELISEKDSVPKGWIKTTMDSVAVIILGQSPPSSTYNQEKKGLPFFQGKTDFGLMYPAVRNWCSDPKKSAEKNDILISVRAPVGPTNISKEKCCIGRGLAAIRPLSGVNYLWIFYHLRLLKNNIAMKGTGTTFKAISGTQLKSIILSIPPLNEQKRIVSKIESIFAQIDAIKERLEILASQTKSTSGMLSVLKKSILKQAFEGKLVPQDLNDKPTNILLKTMHKSSEITTEQNNFPMGWTVTRINEICELIGGGTPSRKNSKYFNGDIMWLTPTEIPKNIIVKIFDSKEKITALGLKKSSAKIIPRNSVLLTSRASIGYIAIAGTPVTTNQGFASFVCSNVIHNFYLAYWLMSKTDLLKIQATGTTFKEISKSKLRSLDIFLPPLNEQKRIVSKIESIFGNIDTLNLFCFILRENLFTNLRYFMILYMQHVISEQ